MRVVGPDIATAEIGAASVKDGEFSGPDNGGLALGSARNI
jgi:hypothetical protein